MKKSVFSRILSDLKPYIFSIVLALILAVITVLLTLRIPVLLGQAVDCVLGQGAVDFKEIYHICVVMGITVAATALCQWLMNSIYNHITYKVTMDMRNRAFEACQKMPLSKLDTTSHGDLISRIVTDADVFADGLLMGFTQLFTGILTILGTIVYMFRISWPVTLVVVVLTPVSLFVAKFISENTHKFFSAQAATRGKVTGLINEMIENGSVVRLFNYGDTALERFDGLNNQLTEESLKATFFSSLVNPSTRFVNSLIYAGVGCLGAFLCIKGRVSVGKVTSFLNYASSYAKPFNEITGVLTEFQNALSCAKRLYELIDTKPEIDEGKEEIDSVKGQITLKDVCFSYADANGNKPEKPLIENLNLNVNPGERVAIVGPTGAGKSTIINLLMRFYETDAGEILLDGKNIKNLPKDVLRESFGMVLQETWLKEGTIRENLLVGKPDATEEEMIEAAKKTHAHSFIKRLPKGYDTFISAGGGSLSVGQKQLLCITRVMLNIPPMLILDEATSSIDTRTEQKIQKAFNIMMQGRTTFVVAHRLSTIKEADVILFLKDGRVVEQGNHNSLLQKNGFYARLYKSQFAQLE